MVLKATHEQLRRHNRQLLLRAVYDCQADSRAALAQLSGLTKPTVSSLVAELLDEGLVSEHGHGPSTDSGGKRPRLLRFEPDARQVIGVAVEAGRALAVLSNLAGRITARHIVELADEVRDASRPPHQPEVDQAVTDAVAGLRAQLDAPLLCVGVGVPAGLAVPQADGRSLAIDALQQTLSTRFDVPVYLANTAELCALGQLAFGTLNEASVDPDSPAGASVTLTIDQGVEVGVALGRGAHHYGADIGCLRAMTADTDGGSVSLSETLRWGHTRRRVQALRAASNTSLPEEGLSYLHLRFAAKRGDMVADAVLDELAAALAPVVAWVMALLQPEQITLAGPIVDLGDDFLPRLLRHAEPWTPPRGHHPVRLRHAYAADLGSMGAVALALQGELGLV